MRSYCCCGETDLLLLGLDSYDHEVWHGGKTGDRVLLLFDVWHPDLVPDERSAIVQMFEDAKENGWLQDSK